jgi:(4-(4-[2-(gamma-L-glutamylamino)ethyl]phenoxymethyl)furan-2-yl)methanamine synthase
LACYLRECQLITLRQAAEIHASSGVLSDTAPIVGAGVGRFLVRVLTERMQRAYVDFGDLFPPAPVAGDFALADCAPAAAVAGLALRASGGA